jgi:hypothetical protein
VNATWGDPVKDPGLVKDPDLAGKFFFSLRFFLENTTARWFYRATDDTIINFAKLGRFLSGVEMEHDPLTELVFLGNCVSNGRLSFPQGGSGYLISRRGAEILAPLTRTFVSAMWVPEDIAFEPFLQSLNVTMPSVTSPFFCGHTFGRENLLRIQRGQWWRFPKCPPQQGRSARFCQPFLSPIREIVFFHEWGGEFVEGPQNARIVFAADSRLMWYIVVRDQKICRLIKGT